MAEVGERRSQVWPVICSRRNSFIVGRKGGREGSEENVVGYGVVSAEGETVEEEAGGGGE